MQNGKRSYTGASNYSDLKRRLDEIIKKIDSTLEPTQEKRRREIGTTQILMEPTQQLLMGLPETQIFIPQTQAMTKTQMLMAGNSGVQPVKLATPTAPIFDSPETITQKMMMETQPQRAASSILQSQKEPCSSDSAIASDDRLYEPLTSSQVSSLNTDDQEEEEEIEEVKIQRAKSTSRPWKPPGLTRATRKSNKTRTARPWRPFFADEDS